MRSLTALILLSLALSSSSAHDHGENCGCSKHKRAEFIVDPTDTPPDVHNGQPRWIATPRPEDWDEEDDGPWEPALVDNPDYDWTPRRIPNPKYAQKASYWTELGDEINEAVPWVTLGVILVAAFGIIPLPLHMLRSQLSADGPFNAIKAAILGLATPLCSCGSLPIAAGFVEKGIPLSSVVAFLTASQSAGLDSAAITYGLLGGMAAACRLVGALVLAVVAGIVLRSRAKEEPKKGVSDNIGEDEGLGSESGIVFHFVTLLMDTASQIFPLVLLGLAISTTAVHFIPELTTPFHPMKHNNQMGEILLRIAVLASALPLQLCEHTTAAIAAGIQKAGGSPGLAFAFLLSAPATNLPSLLLLARASGSYGSFTPFKVAMALSGTALLLSYAVDAMGIDLLVVKEADSAGEMASLPRFFVGVSPWISGSLLVAGFLRTLKRKLRRGACPCPSACDGTSASKKHD